MQAVQSHARIVILKAKAYLQQLEEELDALESSIVPAQPILINSEWNLKEENAAELARMHWADDGGPCLD